ncbi:MAG: lipopolysaccharide biosynthesis protein [Desulfosoma sp.]
MPAVAKAQTTSIGRQTASQGESDIARKIISGASWLFALKLSTRGIGFVSTLILARFLTPADFGVLGIAMLSISLLQTLSQTGFEGALIHKKGDISEFLDSAWVISVVRGLVLTSILFFSAPFVASFFGSPQAGAILKVLAFVPFLEGLNNVGLVFFKKEMDFKKLFIFELCGQVVHVLVAVPLALVYPNVWALVVAMIASRAAMLFISYKMHPYRPSIRINWKMANELFAFGKWLLGSQIVLYFINQGDNLFVGKILGTVALGFYAMAYKISFLAVTEVTFVISKVMFPAYSQLQDNRNGLQKAYLGMLTVLAFVSMPLSGMIFLLAEDFVSIVLGAKWLPIYPIIQVFAFSAMLRSVSSTTGALFQGIGRPDITAKLVSIRLAIIALLIYPLTVLWGMVGTALAILVSSAVVDPVALTLGSRLIALDMKAFLSALLLPLGNTLVCLVLSMAVKALFVHLQGIWIAAVMLVVFGCAYVCISYILQHFWEYQAPSFMRKVASHIIAAKARPA